LIGKFEIIGLLNELNRVLAQTPESKTEIWKLLHILAKNVEIV